MPELLAKYDFEEERLDIKNFVIDYFEYRISLDGEEWYESPGLVDGPQEEHKVMRILASIFETRKRIDISKMVEEILEDTSLAFPRFCDVLDEFDREGNDNSKQISYGRLVGIIAFSGCLAAALIRNNQRREVQQILLYTSTFLGTRIRLTWSLEDRSWANFMTFSKDIIRREERSKTEARRQSRRRSFGIIMGVGVVVLGGVVGAKLLRVNRHHDHSPDRDVQQAEEAKAEQRIIASKNPFHIESWNRTLKSILFKEAYQQPTKLSLLLLKLIKESVITEKTVDMLIINPNCKVKRSLQSRDLLKNQRLVSIIHTGANPPNLPTLSDLDSISDAVSMI